MKRILSFLLSTAVCLSIGAAASAAAPVSRSRQYWADMVAQAAAQREATGQCPHAWDTAPLGKTFYERDEASGGIRLCQTFQYRCVCCGDYYYRSVPLRDPAAR